MESKNIANKILILGISASGKSVFARKLAKKLNLPLTHVDSTMWKPGWNYIGDEETVNHLVQISNESKWIIEGYIEDAARETVFNRADLIIYLDYSSILSSWRYFKRWWKHRKNARPELEGSPEKFSFKFLKLVWTKGEAISLKEDLKKVEPQSKIMVFRKPGEAEGFLDGF